MAEAACVWLCGDHSVEGPYRVMSAGTPQEQLMLELVNRARMDPLAEAARLGIDLNQGLTAGTISAAPKQVLAMNAFLQKSADNHSAWMLTHDRFSHTADPALAAGWTGASPGDRMAAAGYTFSGSWAWGENIAWRGTTGTLDPTSSIVKQHESLFLSAGHRVNILNGSFQEVGVGQQTGVFTYNGVNYNASMVTQNFARSGVAVFVTGVVYNDTTNNDFYDVGEQVAGRSVSAVGATTDVTGAGGGYALKFTAGGAKTVSFSLATGVVTATVQVGTENAKVDLVSSNQIWSNTTISSVSSNVLEIHALGITAINLTGAAGNQLIVGNIANNVLNGAAGADTMRGLGGNDTYIVDNTGDRADESVAGSSGIDTVQSSVSFTLGVNVENLTLTGTAAINGTGNTLDNILTGNAAANALNGAAGADVMRGLGGNDTYTVDSIGDLVDETAPGSGGIDKVLSAITYVLGANVENLTLTGLAAVDATGNELANILVGNAGANVLNGMEGADKLTGGAGADTFVFSTALGGVNIDSVLDYNVAADTIALDNAVFTALADGGLTTDAFVRGAVATDANDRIIYNPTNGALSYDADGNGALAAVKFATLSLNLAMTHQDFVVV